MIDCISLLKQLCVALKTSAFSIVCPKYPQKASRCRAWSTFWHTAHLTPSHMSFGIDTHLLLRIRLTLPVHFINRSHWLRTCRTAQRHWLFRRWAVYKPCTFSLQQNLVKVYIWCNSTKTVNTRFLALTFFFISRGTADGNVKRCLHVQLVLSYVPQEVENKRGSSNV